MRIKKRIFKGQTIVEVIVALGAGVMILSAMILVILTALNNSQQGASESQATTYAQEAMEKIRQMKENSWSTYSALSGSYCMAASCSAVTSQTGSCGPKSPSCTANISNKYIREVTISRSDSGCIPPTPVSNVTYSKVAVTVSWTDSKCTSVANPYCHVVKLESCLSNFNVRSAP